MMMTTTTTTMRRHVPDADVATVVAYVTTAVKNDYDGTDDDFVATFIIGTMYHANMYVNVCLFTCCFISTRIPYTIQMPGCEFM